MSFLQRFIATKSMAKHVNSMDDLDRSIRFQRACHRKQPACCCGHGEFMSAENSYDKAGNQAAFMNGLYWWGVPTLFRCQHDADPANCDIALVGVPHSSGNGSTERDQHLGPRAVRNVSAIGRRVHNAFRLDPWKACRINDLGDVPLSEGNNNEKSIATIKAYYDQLGRAGTRPVSIGGDHSITGAIIQGLVSDHSRLTGGKKIALLHFDAHTDTFHHMDHFMGAVRSAAHWASYIVQEGQVDAPAARRSAFAAISGPSTGSRPAMSWVMKSCRWNASGRSESPKATEMFLDRIGDSPGLHHL